jgi:hypothetical protein
MGQSMGGQVLPKEEKAEDVTLRLEETWAPLTFGMERS